MRGHAHNECPGTRFGIQSRCSSKQPSFVFSCVRVKRREQEKRAAVMSSLRFSVSSLISRFLLSAFLCFVIVLPFALPPLCSLLLACFLLISLPTEVAPMQEATVLYYNTPILRSLPNSLNT
ncbi:hypothetical protein ACHAWT_007711 [Skeletonema menzelii]